MLRCVRPDGSVTWQRHHGRQDAFFPLHDLTHLAVETELGLRTGFYGLLAAGWSIEDTTGKGTRGPLPLEAVMVEHLVGLVDIERAGGTAWTAKEFNEQAAEIATSRGLPVPRTLTEAELIRVRARVRELLSRWAALAPGGTMEVPFVRCLPSA